MPARQRSIYSFILIRKGEGRSCIIDADCRGAAPRAKTAVHVSRQVDNEAGGGHSTTNSKAGKLSSGEEVKTLLSAAFSAVYF